MSALREISLSDNLSYMHARLFYLSQQPVLMLFCGSQLYMSPSWMPHKTLVNKYFLSSPPPETWRPEPIAPRELSTCEYTIRLVIALVLLAVRTRE